MDQPILTIGDQHFEPESATLEILVKIETWDSESQSWVYDVESTYPVYGISIRVDERSGGDGAPAPSAQTVYFEPDENEHFPLPPDLVSREFDDEESDWDAWLGNDAPELLENRLKVLAWNEGRLRVDWRAKSDSGDWFRYQGDLDVVPIRLQIKQLAEADRVLEGVFGPGAPSRLERVETKRLDYGEDWAEDRRRWFSLSYEVR